MNEQVDDALQNLALAAFRLKELTDKNFTIMQLQDLLSVLTEDDEPIPKFDDPLEDGNIGC